MRDAHDAVERIVWQGDEFVDAGQRAQRERRERPIPTLADVGELWSFQDDIRMRAEEFGDLAERLHTILVGVDCLRLDATVARVNGRDDDLAPSWSTTFASKRATVPSRSSTTRPLTNSEKAKRSSTAVALTWF